MVLRFNKINKDIFNAIRIGKKKVETRAATVKYARIGKGESIVFVCGTERFEKLAKRVWHYKSIESLLKDYKPEDIVPTCKTHKELETVYYSFPGYKEKIAKEGLIAIELGD